MPPKKKQNGYEMAEFVKPGKIFLQILESILFHHEGKKYGYFLRIFFFEIFHEAFIDNLF